MRRLLRLFLLFFLLTSVAQAREVVIGLASNFSEVSSGSSNPYGGYFKDGATLALRNSEAKLKARDITVRFQEFDYGDSETKVLDAAQHAARSEAIAVLGYNYSSDALLAAPIHQAAKLPMLTPSASANRLGQIGRYVHQGCFNNAFMAETLARTARRTLKARQAAIITATNCAYCNDLADSFEHSFRALGGTVPVKLAVLHEDRDFTSVIKRLKEYPFDLVFIPNQELASARLIAALAASGVHTPFLGADGWGNVGTEFFSILKGVSFTGYAVSHWHPQMSTPGSRAFVQSYRSAFGKNPNDTSVLAYDSMRLLIEALLRSKALTREGLENSLDAMERFHGVTGDYQLRPNRPPRKSLVLLKAENPNFKIVRVIPPARDAR